MLGECCRDVGRGVRMGRRVLGAVFPRGGMVVVIGPATVPRERWEWFGNHGHLIVGRDCRFHLATLVGPWWVSTVGEWLPDERSREIHADVRGVRLEGRGDERLADFMRKFGWVEIGSGRKYETMVFPAGDERCQSADCGCGMPSPSYWSELDSDGYNDAGTATRGHYAMCEKWAARPAGSGPAWEDEDAA